MNNDLVDRVLRGMTDGDPSPDLRARVLRDLSPTPGSDRLFPMSARVAPWLVAALVTLVLGGVWLGRGLGHGSSVRPTVVVQSAPIAPAGAPATGPSAPSRDDAALANATERTGPPAR